MKKDFSALLLAFLRWLFSSQITGVYHKAFTAPEDILLAQLKGHGCRYQYGCAFDWEHYPGYNIRKSDMHCRMMAARCVLLLKVNNQRILLRVENSQFYLPNALRRVLH